MSYLIHFTSYKNIHIHPHAHSLKVTQNFSLTWKFSLQPSVYQKEVNTLGHKVESFVSGHQVLDWVNYDARYTSAKLKSIHQARNRFPCIQHKLKVYLQGTSTEQHISM